LVATSAAGRSESKYGVISITSLATAPASFQTSVDFGKPFSPCRMKYWIPVAPLMRARYVIARISCRVGSRCHHSPPPNACGTIQTGF